MAASGLHVLQVYKDYYPPVKGGIECHLNLLSNALRDAGVEVHVLVASTDGRYRVDTHDRIEVTKTPQWGRFYSAPLTPSFAVYLRRLGKHADIIHFHHPNPTAEVSYLFSGLNRKLVTTYHSDIIRQDKLGKLYAPFRHLFLKASDRIIATSPNYVATSPVLNRHRDKCTVIPLGIDIARFDDDRDRSAVARIRRRWGDEPMLLFVGRFRYYKGLHVLISAMQRVRAQLLLIGEGGEGPNLRRLAAEKQVGGRVHFLGELPDEAVNAYYKACDIFVLPSHLRSEAFGLVQLEAMACGKPVVSTDIGTGTSFVNKDRETGMVVSPGDVDALASALQYLIDHPDRRRRWGQNGRRRVQARFSGEQMVSRILSLYRELVGPQDRRRPWP